MEGFAFAVLPAQLARANRTRRRPRLGRPPRDKTSISPLGNTFFALADPTRRAILERLSRGPSSVSELGRPFGMSMPAVSKHLGVLERAGLVRRSRHGREHSIQLVVKPLRDASAWMDAYASFWEGQLDSLEEYFADQRKEEED